MARPATCECAKCFMRTPKATSREFVRNIRSGQSSGMSWGLNSRGQRTNVRQSRNVQYRRKAYWLCKACNAKYENYCEDRSAFRGGLAITLLVIGGIAAAAFAMWLYFTNRHVDLSAAIPLALPLLAYAFVDDFNGFLRSDHTGTANDDDEDDLVGDGNDYDYLDEPDISKPDALGRREPRF